MKNLTLTVGSVTYAIKLRKLLARDGIKSRLVKVDNTLTKNGCSHGLEISDSDFYRAVIIMKENNIDYSIHKPQNDIS